MSSCSRSGAPAAQRCRRITSLRNQLATRQQAEMKVSGRKKGADHQTLHVSRQRRLRLVGSPADATHDTLSHFTTVRVASLTALILKDYPGEGHYTEHRLAPSSLLLHWIILASSSLISLEHHLCMLFLGYYLQESECFGEHRPSFTFPAGETQLC